MRKLVSISLLIAALTLTIVTPALAANDTPEAAEQLSPNRSAIGGSLLGRRSGAFAYYSFEYPGANLPVVVTLNVDQPHGSMGSAVGFNLYGPTGLVGSGLPLDGNPDSTVARLPMSHPAAGQYLIQVFNYTDGGSFNFTVDVAGLIGAPPTVTGEDRPETAPVLQSPQPAMAGTLTGSSAGAHAFFQIEYPGGGTDLNVTVTFIPRFPASRDALGFHVWRGSELLGSSREVQETGEVVVHEFHHEGTAPESLGLEIFNYADGHTVSYTVAASGLAAPVTTVSENTTPDRAVAIQGGATTFAGSIDGQRAGSFAFFTLPHPGGAQQVRLVLEFARDSRLSPGEVGFNVYDGSDLVAHVLAEPDEIGRFIASVLLDPASAKTFGIQVFNYGEGTSAAYRLYAIGL